MGLGEGSWGKGILKKNVLGQNGKEPFCNASKFYIEIFNIYYTFKVSRELISERSLRPILNDDDITD